LSRVYEYFFALFRIISNIDTSIQSQAEWIASLLDILESPDFLELEEDLNEHISKIDKGQFIGIRQSTGNIIYKSKQLDQNLPLDTEVLKRALDNENTLEKSMIQPKERYVL